jgi:hypothetical protein
MATANSGLNNLLDFIITCKEKEGPISNQAMANGNL